MAVRVIHEPQHHTLGVARRIAGTETAHTRRRAPRSHTHQTDRGKEAVVTTMATAGQRIDCIAGDNAA
jgi:hypothetical protein